MPSAVSWSERHERPVRADMSAAMPASESRHCAVVQMPERAVSTPAQ